MPLLLLLCSLFLLSFFVFAVVCAGTRRRSLAHGRKSGANALEGTKKSFLRSILLVAMGISFDATIWRDLA